MTGVVHLGGEDGLLEAAARVRAADGEGDLVLVVPEGAPALANPLFVRALRDERRERPLVLVTADQRARAMASGCRVPAYANLAAYQQRSVDPTERLERARAQALVEIGRERRLTRRRRINALAAVTLGLALLAIVMPSAELVVAADPVAVGPTDLEIRTLPAGDVAGDRLSAQVNEPVEGRASGVRPDPKRATGVERFRNATLSAIAIPAGTIVSTPSNVQFRTTEARTLPASQLLPNIVISEIQIPIEAVVPGPSGNVPRDTITRTSDLRLRVTNDQPTAGGEDKRIPVVTPGDYATALSRLDAALEEAARRQVAAWAAAPPAGKRVEETYALRVLSRTESEKVVGTEVETFRLVGVAEIVAYAVPNDEPRASATRRLGESLRPGYVLDRDSVDVDTTDIEATTDGLLWRVRARASQRPRLDEGSLRLALFGQDRASAERVLLDRGLRLVELRSFPGWWPRLPLLPLRIDLRSGSAAALSAR